MWSHLVLTSVLLQNNYDLKNQICTLLAIWLHPLTWPPPKKSVPYIQDPNMQRHVFPCLQLVRVPYIQDPNVQRHVFLCLQLVRVPYIQDPTAYCIVVHFLLSCIQDPTAYCIVVRFLLPCVRIPTRNLYAVTQHLLTRRNFLF